MKCAEFMDKSYGSDLFCRTCGMDIGLNPIKINNKGNIEYYCCEDCKKTR